MLEDSVLVFDSGFSLIQARCLDRAIRSVTSKKVRYLVNSHDHSDHVFGNSYFWKKYRSGGLAVISHELCRSRMIEFGPRRLEGYRRVPGLEKSLQGIEIQSSTLTFSDVGVRVDIEGVELVFSHPPTGAHTLGDTVLYLPEEKIAFMGDILWNRFLPNLEDANLEGWLSYLEQIDLETYRRLVPGHGEVCGSDRLIEFRNYLKKVREKLLTASQVEKQDQDFLRSCFSLAGTEDWKLKLIIDFNVDSIFSKKTGS